MLSKQNPRPPYAGLTQNQADEAKAFLRAILLGDTMAKDAGVRMDVAKCVQAYRGHVGRVTV